ncbi:MAG: rhomboid family intramembrane serine protease [Aureliella sp.]
MDFAMDVEEVFRSNERAACFEARLVLESLGIKSISELHDGMWRLTVAQPLAPRALAELDSYAQERLEESRAKPAPIKLYGGATAGVIVYVVCITAVAWLSRGVDAAQAWRSIGRMQAGLIVDGQWWRTITALTLHVDFAHLMGNIAFGTLFGFLAGRSLGGGAGWLAIVIGGGLGNFANACLRDEYYSAIGASTAVFAALGILVTRAIFPRRSDTSSLFQRMQPLIGGILLFAFTGIGDEQTDVGAHFCGMVAGMLLGGLATVLPEKWFASPSIQACCGVAALAIVVAAWGAAIWS